MKKQSSSIPARGADLIHGAPAADAQWWFRALEQRSLSAGAERWLAQVVGIHVDGRDVWIQLESPGEDRRDLTIRVKPGTSVNDVVGAIETLFRDAVRPSR